MKTITGLMLLFMLALAFCMVVMPAQAAHVLKATSVNTNQLYNFPPDAWIKYTAVTPSGYLLLYSYNKDKGLVAAGKTSIKVGNTYALKIGDGQCVAFVRAISTDSSIPSTQWIRGKKVSSGDISGGTAIATFNSANIYSPGHTAIFGNAVTTTSSNVWDQNFVASSAVGRHTLTTSSYNVVEILDTYIAAHFAYTGDKAAVKEPNIVTDGYKNNIESFRIHSDSPDYSIQYCAHVANIGWQNYVSEDQNAGTQNKGNAIEAFKIKLINAPKDTHVYYRAYYNNGWGPWVSDNAQAGTTGASIPVKGMQVYIGTGSPSTSIPNPIPK